MTSSPEKNLSIRNYFVDEAGDATLFDRRGNTLIESPGCSRFFILGLVDMPETETLACELGALRARLLSDPYFKKVPSMQPEARKTALAFHALWALQRLYERQEDRYVELLWPSFRLVQDIDDTREAKYGAYYTQKKPLNCAAIERSPGI